LYRTNIHFPKIFVLFLLITAARKNYENSFFRKKTWPTFNLKNYKKFLYYRFYAMRRLVEYLIIFQHTRKFKKNRVSFLKIHSWRKFACHINQVFTSFFYLIIKSLDNIYDKKE